MAKLIAKVGVEAEVLEIYFSEPLPEIVERNLELGLRGQRLHGPEAQSDRSSDCVGVYTPVRKNR